LLFRLLLMKPKTKKFLKNLKNQIRHYKKFSTE
jgi:hypothetical protein